MATPRRLVLCLDGTSNSAYNQKRRSDGHSVIKPSNVLKLCRSVEPRGSTSGRDQLTYYDVGVGSLAVYPGAANRLLQFADKTMGGAFGAGFEGNVDDALSFLVLNLSPGDEVFVFGFSRGAATARALTRYLDWAGGLPSKEDAYYLPLLFRAYVESRGERPSADVVAEINAQRARERRPLPPLGAFQPVHVAFLGVWDTVMALGSRFRSTRGSTTAEASRSFHVGAQPARCVRHARQALSIDEARYDFRPEIWTGLAPGQTMAQRWFAGVHSNVGGGYVDDGLANIPFHWILGEAQAVGLEVDAAFARRYHPYPQDRLYRSESTLYRVLDGIRLRGGRGRRSLLEQPATANLTLDPSAIQRLAADPAARKPDGGLRFPDLRRAYRPQNLLQFLACQSDLDAYLAGLGLTAEQRRLPADVSTRLAKLRPNCAA